MARCTLTFRNPTCSVGPSIAIKRKFARRIQSRGLVAGNAAGPDKNDLTGTLGLHLLSLRGEIESLLQIQRRGARLGLIDGEMNLLAVRFKEQRGRGQDVGANHHDAIGRRKGVHIVVGRQARSIDEAGLAEPARPSMRKYRESARDRASSAPEIRGEAGRWPAAAAAS